ncbi:YciI family protein [Actinosynnema sp. NPDC050801]|uniref:YciI family protein n=1 Tax=unclassified Actinosynnema TaxID=2637065 RepID=UPI0033E62239
MRYLVLIYSNPESRAIWDRMGNDERSAGLDAYAALDEELAASGELVVSEALAEPALTTRVTVRDGRALTTDGPFAETKELLAGFYLVEVPTRERAVRIAARIPEARLGLVEVRPALSSLDDFLR